MGRGIPQQVQDDLLTASRLFFAQPNEVNAEVANLRSPHLRVWTRVATEHTDGAAPDLREQLGGRNASAISEDERGPDRTLIGGT